MVTFNAGLTDFIDISGFFFLLKQWLMEAYHMRFPRKQIPTTSPDLLNKFSIGCISLITTQIVSEGLNHCWSIDFIFIYVQTEHSVYKTIIQPKVT